VRLVTLPPATLPPQITVLNVVYRPLPFPISEAEGQASSSSGKGGAAAAEPIKEDTRLKNRVLDLRWDVTHYAHTYHTPCHGMITDSFMPGTQGRGRVGTHIPILGS
jgi:hypothetical protein